MHALYRFYNGAGDLLYVGITNDPPRRFAKHRGEKSWWTEVASITIQHHPSRDALLDAERSAIQAERPLYNIRLNRGNTPLERGTLPRGLRVGNVYALALRNGECPVGLITAGDRDGVTIDLYSWMTQLFAAGEMWIDAEDISRWKRAEREELADRTVFHMDPLGDYQTEWTTLFAKVSERLAGR